LPSAVTSFKASASTTADKLDVIYVVFLVGFLSVLLGKL
jgi:hypothetical protein